MGMEWFEFSANSKAISGLYDTVPRLENISIFEVTITHTLLLHLRIELNEFPKFPPSKWHKEFNSIQITLIFSISKFEGIRGWPLISNAKISIQKNELGDILVNASGEDFHLSFLSDGFRIDGITGYKNG